MEIIGHRNQIKFLEKMARKKRVPHALLFSGQEKLGKKKIALEVASWFLGKELRTHPDFILITPLQQKFGSGQIQINQIREFSWRLSLKPMKAPLMVGIIDQAHLMTEEAQNCFLKTLGEPRGNTILILITEYPEFLFSTIRSRAEIIKFYPVPKKEIENYLKEQGIEGRQAQLISQISQGKPGEAIDFLNQPQKLKEREELINEIIRLTKIDLISRFQYVKKISKSPQLKEILNIWLSYFRENLISSLNSKVEPWKIGKLVKISEKIQETFFLISTTNVNPRLALETLMLEL